MKTQFEAWGWVNHADQPQQETFESPDQAVAAMKQRTGMGDDVLEKMHKVGLDLARVRVTIEPVLKMAPVKPAGAE